MRVTTTDRSNIRAGQHGTATFLRVDTVYPNGGGGVQVVWFNVAFDHGSIVIQQLGRDIIPLAEQPDENAKLDIADKLIQDLANYRSPIERDPNPDSFQNDLDDLIEQEDTLEGFVQRARELTTGEQPGENASSPASTMEITESHLDTAACLWEQALLLQSEQPHHPIPIEIEARGTAQARSEITAMAPDCEAAWEALTHDEQFEQAPFDWEFVPKWLEQNHPYQS